MALAERSPPQAFGYGFKVIGVASKAETPNKSLQLTLIASGIREYVSRSHKMQPMLWA
jgi:hypothetical protein